MNCKFLFWIAAIFIANILLQTGIYCQQLNLNFQNYNKESGLASNTVTGIIQDDNGFMWFSTEEGLSRFDGIEFRNFRHDPNDTNSIGFNVIYGLVKDKQGNLWMCTDENIVDRYDMDTEKFIHYKCLEEEPEVYGLLVDKENRIWCKSFSGLYYVDKKHQVVKKYFVNNPKIDRCKVVSMAVDHSNNLLIANKEYGLFRINTKSKKVEQFILVNNHLDTIKEILYVFIDSKEKIWVVTNSEIGIYDDKNNKYTTKLENVNIIEIRGVTEDNRRNIWFAIEGLIVYDRAKDKFERYMHNISDENTLASDFTVIPFIDNQGTLWISHDIEGVDHSMLKNIYEFKHYKKNDNDAYSLSNNFVTCFESKSEDYLWVGTATGLDYLDRKSSKFTHYLKGKKIYDILEDEDSTIWVITIKEVGFDKFVYPIFIKKKDDIDFKAYKNDSIDEEEINYFFYEEVDCIWLFCFSGAYKINKLDKKTTFYSNNFDLDPYFLVTCAKDPRGFYWISSVKGLIKFVPSSNTWEIFSEDMVWDIYIGKDNTLWCLGETVINYEDDYINIRRLSTYEGLPEGLSFNITAHGDNLWIGTITSLTKYNKKSMKTVTYNKFDGVANIPPGYCDDNVNNFRSVFKTVNGEIALGGYNGFNLFNPDSIKINDHKPPVYILDFQIFNQSVPVGEFKKNRIILEKPISQTKKLNLSYRDAVFSFEFIALDYANPSKNQYAYKMEGFEDDWNYTDGSYRKATYTNLSGGNYTFKVKAANNDGIWNEEGRSIDIFIRPPFWNTLGFKIIIVILLLGTVIFIILRILAKAKLSIYNERNQLLTLINDLPDLAFVKDIDCRFVIANNSLLELLGVKKLKDLIGKSDFDFYPKESATKFFNEEKNLMNTRKPFTEESDFKTFKLSNEEKYISVTKSPLISSKGNVIGLVGVGRDLTNIKKAGIKLEKQAAKLKELNATKDKFFSIIAHDLRSPFGVVLGFAELLQLNYPELDEDEKTQYISEIFKSADNIQKLLDNLLFWARSQSGNLDIKKESFMINEIVELNRNLLKESCRNKNLKIISVIKDEYVAYADRNMINTVIRNLLTNAIKFTQPGGTISIACSSTADKITVSVSDTGIGMPAETIENLFKIEKNTSRKGTNGESGTGLGLILCKEFIEKNDGEIWAESVEGSGSTIYFTTLIGC